MKSTKIWILDKITGLVFLGLFGFLLISVGSHAYTLGPAYDLIEKEEGFRSTAYYDNLGYATIGIGNKVSDVKFSGLSQYESVTYKQAVQNLNNKVNHINSRLIAGKYGKEYASLSMSRKYVILSMGFQMGITGLYKFENMWKYIGEKDYVSASKEMLKSKWSEQTPKRSRNHALIMELGEPNNVVVKKLAKPTELSTLKEVSSNAFMSLVQSLINATDYRNVSK